MYWKVETDKGEQGFVSVLKMKRNKAKVSGKLSAALQKAVQQGRSEDDSSNIRSRSAVMGVRGLDESDVASAGNVKPNKRMVQAMENITIQSSEIEKIAELVEKEVEFKSTK